MILVHKDKKVKKYKKAKASEIPFVVWLLENPQSTISLPGRISLEDHDYLHLLLDCDMSSAGEAFVIGSCMGSDPDTKKIHILIFKFFAKYVYPQAYRLSKEDLAKFDRGFSYGKYLYCKNKIALNTIKSFDCQKKYSVEQIRSYLEINLEEQRNIMSDENNTKPNKKHLIKALRISSSICAILGGFLVASKLTISGYGFIILALSSSQLLISSILDRDKFLVFYSAAVFLFVDLYGIYRWLLA
ncbi:MAG: hypothetical protein KME09_00255 [Pleurocapsa minor HA4230-MV1]|jgi:hypothetical protein|nr:hypothetical protein [Pleurocapsa minor HA4230-MV1]